MSRFSRIEADYLDPDKYHGFDDQPCQDCGSPDDECKCPVCKECGYVGPRPSGSICPDCGEPDPPEEDLL